MGSRTPALGGGGGSSQGMRRDGSERGEEALLNGGGVGGRRSVRLPLGIQLRRSVGFTVNAAIAVSSLSFAFWGGADTGGVG